MREFELRRTTKETDISLWLSLEGGEAVVEEQIGNEQGDVFFAQHLAVACGGKLVLAQEQEPGNGEDTEAARQEGTGGILFRQARAEDCERSHKNCRCAKRNDACRSQKLQSH